MQGCYHRGGSLMAEPIAIEDVPGPGTVLGGRYHLQHLVGEGGMGRVFVAHDERDGGLVAVKVLADDRPIPKAAQRFEREARAIARIDHANVVRVTDVGESPRGGIYYVMEYLEGEELADTLAREGPLPWPRARHIALQICGGLQAAHEAGVVHRDLKLENCFRVERDGDPDFVKILDFGVVKLLAPDTDADERLTNTGATLGTPAYMAPELCRGKQVDHRVDVYALGVMLYELLTGSVPFDGDSFLDVALKHMNEPPPPLAEHLPPDDVPDGLEAVLMRALAKPREDRFPTMAAFGRALERVGQAVDEPRATEPNGLPLTAAGGTVPVLTAAGDAPSGGTVPALASVYEGTHELDEPARPRVAKWPWLVAGGVVVAGLAGWLAVAAPAPEPLPHGEPVAVVERLTPPSGAEATPPPPAPSVDTEPTASTGPEPEPAAASTGPAPVAAPGRDPTRPSPPNLSERQIDEALRRVQPLVKACAGRLTGGRHGEEVRVILRVARATGRVTSVRAAVPGNRFAVESCLVDALLKAPFARVGGTGTQRVERKLVL